MRQNYEAQTPEEALPAWVLVKRRTLEVLYGTHDLLREYRRRPSPRKLRAFANGVLDLYLLVKDKAPKVKDCKTLVPKLVGLDKYGYDLPEDLNAQEWCGYFDTLITVIEAIGITKIMLPSTRIGAELLEGTVMGQYIDEAQDYADAHPI